MKKWSFRPFMFHSFTFHTSKITNTMTTTSLTLPFQKTIFERVQTVGFFTGSRPDSVESLSKVLKHSVSAGLRCWYEPCWSLILAAVPGQKQLHITSHHPI